MTEPSPNEQQEELITSTEGIYRVNAGAGTGKTFAVTRRYAEILETTDATPEEILLVTFTRNAAAEMKDRIVQQTDYDLRELQDAPISTFHSYCYQLLRRYGHTIPEALGIGDQIPDGLDLIEDQVQERQHFRTFMSRFADRHPEHADLLRIFRDRTTLRSLIGQLAAKGVIPTRDGWYRDTAAPLTGDRAAFEATLAETNAPGEGSRGPTNSDARGSVAGWDVTEYAPGAPDRSAVHDDPQVNEALVLDAFDEDREALRAFLHDVYIEYLAFALSRNYLTQGLMLALAFVMLCEEPGVRAAVSHEYVMVDEFQDTNELQFKIALLLASTNNICVVGDWKQSIYGFQYTSVENITEFESRLSQYAAELNSDTERIDYPVDDIESIPLVQNYRSSASILDFAEQSLSIRATYSEDLNEDPLAGEASLEATNHVDNARIEAYQAADEYDLILDRIQTIVGNDDYAVEVRDDPAATEDMSPEEQRAAEQKRLGAPSYSDIAVFTRKRNFARELLNRAAEYNVPIAYEGGVELFDTPEAKLLLAWLRICESDDTRGWAVVLERAGYTFGQTESILEDEAYPDAMVAFRDELLELETIGALAQRVFDRYDLSNAFADALLDHLTGVYEGTLMTRSEAIAYITDNLENGSTVEIDTSPGQDAVTLQTIHGAKGLEYPIVLLGNLNYRAFPHYGQPPSSPIVYQEPLGLRQRRVFTDEGSHPHVFTHWPYDLLTSCLPSEYDEERRLLYVAMTRAKRHLLFTAGEDPSLFFSELSVEATEVDPAPSEQQATTEATAAFEIEIPASDGQPRRHGVHDIMDDSVYEEGTGGRGTAFGNELHDFAEAYVLGEAVEPSNEDEENVVRLIDGLEGESKAEETVLLPLDTDPAVTLTGIIDLLHITPERVDVIDYKTDLSRVAESEYRKQLSAYYHVLTSVYPEREICPQVFYTADNKLKALEPISNRELIQAVEETLC
ncbi:UvrD-helicase domain-containing protein [Haloglomus halophilum]|uniref:UvrD-helicase domain-containing protein n=1 Tax=Haloglomus halophilum TaxID=2962672 RepID=UPI0020C9A67F|nr:ATP-dependent DNA helicase [Haloglomus halophilum]